MLPFSKWRQGRSAYRVRRVGFWVRMKGVLVHRESHFSKLPALKINQILSQGTATQSPSQTVNSLWWEAEVDWKKNFWEEEKRPNEGTSGVLVGSELPLGMHHLTIFSRAGSLDKSMRRKPYSDTQFGLWLSSWHVLCPWSQSYIRKQRGKYLLR